VLAEAVRGVMAQHPKYRYEHIFIDNASRNGTRWDFQDPTELLSEFITRTPPPIPS